ncbi:MAG: hypothetical protein LN561_06415 [Rickettsia endosymbiont of Labidopullus appendiculatus]|nr:hypothetical protein [Rickettsia endosymbiont of Labidopullus appendiculatus]
MTIAMKINFEDYVNFKDYVKDGNFLDLADKKWISNNPNILKKLSLFLQNNPGITALNLKNCDIDSAKFELLIALIKESNISNLDISSNPLGDVGAAKIAELSNLTALDIACTALTDVAVDEIAKLTNLTTLNMSCNKLSTKGAAKLGVLSNLVVLDLSYTSLGTKLGTPIDELTKLAKLNELSELTKLSKLTKLYIEGCHLDFTQIEKLSNLSSCHIIFKDTEDELVKLMQDANNPDINLTHERVKNMVFKLAPSYNFDSFISMVINSPEKYPFAINSRDNDGHSLLHFYNDNPKVQQFLFQHGIVPDQDNRLKTLVQDKQSVHTKEAVKLVNLIIDNLFKAYGNIENKLAQNGQYNPGYPTHKMEYCDGHKIKALIDTMEIPVAEELELLVTLMRQNPELVATKLEIIQKELGIDVPLKILVDSTTCHKFLASSPVIQKNPQTIGDLFNSLSGLDIKQTWREQKAFTVAEKIYIAATTYNADGTGSACIHEVWTQIIKSTTEINKDFYDEFVKLQEQNLKEERERTSITETNIQEFIGVLVKKLINFVEEKPALQERLADLEFAMIDMTKPQDISIEQQEFLAQINIEFAKIKKYLPNYKREMPTADEYALIIKNLVKHHLIEKFAKNHYKLQESTLQLDDDISDHSSVEEYQQPLDDQDVVETIGNTEGY